MFFCISGKWSRVLANHSQIVQKLKNNFVLSYNYSLNSKLFQNKIKHVDASTCTFLSFVRKLSILSVQIETGF